MLVQFSAVIVLIINRYVLTNALSKLFLPHLAWEIPHTCPVACKSLSISDNSENVSAYAMEKCC